MVHYKTWHWSFYIQAVGILPCSALFLILPSKYFEIASTIRFKKKCAHLIEKKLFKTINVDQIMNKESSGSENSPGKTQFNQEFKELLDQLTDKVLSDAKLPKNKKTIMKLR